MNDLTGQKWGRMTAIRFVEWRYWSNGKRDPIWLWRCDCGNEKECLTTNVKSGQAQSCGCYLSERMVEVHATHGKSKSRMYKVFMGIKNRCDNPNSPNYQKYYGAKGIKLEWSCFEYFERDMGPTYQEGLTIGRIDSKKNYCKENCRWETYQQQNSNKSDNRNITHNGETKTVTAWAAELQMPQTTLFSRLALGWSIDKALTTRVRYKTPKG